MFEAAFWLAPLSALFFTVLLCRRFLAADSWFHVLDQPGHRSLHETPVPRTGGIALITSVAVCWTAAVAVGWLHWIEPWGWVLSGMLALGLLGALDDRFDLPAVWRLLVQAVIAGGLVYAGFELRVVWLPGLSFPLPDGLAALISFLFILWMINLYNFMDGMDGFAGGMGSMGFAVLGYLGWQMEHYDYALAAWVVAGANLGFLWFNFPPAKIFMGDAGAPTLGMLVAVFALWADREELFPLWMSLLIFSVFVVDASFTLMRRTLRGEKIWQAHREHLYQRLVLSGWSHKKTLLWAYALMLSSGVTAVQVWNRPAMVQWMVLGVWAMLFGVLILRFGFRKI